MALRRYALHTFIHPRATGWEFLTMVRADDTDPSDETVNAEA